MFSIYKDDGEIIAEMPLTEKQLAALDEGGEIAVIFHTPQLQRTLLGERSGAFSLHKHGDRIVTSEPQAFKIYADMQKAIAAAQRAN
jgi:hypothetical protein